MICFTFFSLNTVHSGDCHLAVTLEFPGAICSDDRAQRLAITAGANRKIGLDDKLFVLADSVLVTGLGRIALMPCLVLAARVCPEVTQQ